MNADIGPFAFVLMPFDDNFKDVYNFGIKQACADAGIVAERVDEQVFSETILERIYRQIENADIIIAEMTGQNANVFYEVGYSHAKGKLCIMATQSASDIPFDLKQHPHIIYDGTASDLREKISTWLDWAKQKVIERKTQTLTVEARHIGASLEKTEYSHTGTFELILKLRNRTNRRSPELESIFVQVLSSWTVQAHGKDCPYELVEDNKSKRVLLTPSIKRIGPDAFSEERISLKRQFWNTWDGHEEKEAYKISGTIFIEIMTSEGTLRFETPMKVTFEDIPF
ncbi:hypothetical protein [Parasedimentitalea maritima]|uniref:Nucleoside 2-deoxyribosyltransferase n=1 Tax=Parasedimentitalea maritima TaxID=2578117 RepID=A0A6A4RA20_9RHOB|nr:hypothetical protein [Zongyanglinia marina]KAE9625120.1 hypothetical protein GP644_22625 [Zongyanglinia marina]